MAIYHLNIRYGNRASGKSARSKSDYINREGKYKTDADEVLALGSGNMPTWAKDFPASVKSEHGKYWAAADMYEAINGRVFTEIVFALPNELSLEENEKLVREFADYIAEMSTPDIKGKLPYSYAIHRGKGANTHCHLLISDRVNDGLERDAEIWFKRAASERYGKKPQDGGARKTRYIQKKEWLLKIRTEWAKKLNEALEENKINDKVDHRSFRDQGIKLEPGIKVGLNQDDLKDSGFVLATERQVELSEIMRRNGERIIADPAIFIDYMTKRRSSFNEHELARELFYKTADQAQFTEALLKVKSHPSIVKMGADEKGYTRYTTNDILQKEKDLFSAALNMSKQSTHAVDDKHLNDAIANRTLSSEQLSALRTITSNEQISAIVGIAGSGKSYLLEAAKDAWEKSGYRVSGAALAGIAAQNLQDSGIESKTLAAWEYAFKNGATLSKKDVIIIDEAGMIGTEQLEKFISLANKSGAKVVLVGDHEQLQAIDRGAAFRGILTKIQRATLKTVRRQKESWQQTATENFTRDKTAQSALKAYADNGCIREYKDEKSTVDALVNRFIASMQDWPEKSHLALAYEKKFVRQINEKVRAKLRLSNPTKSQFYATYRGNVEYAESDRIVFLKNDKRMGVKNGLTATITNIDETIITAKTDEGKIITIDSEQYKDIDYGWAVTVHKSQGMTVDKTFVLASKLFDRHTAYVAMSRHKEHAEMHYSGTQFSGLDDLVEKLGKSYKKDLAFDYIDSPEAASNSESLAKARARLWERNTPINGSVLVKMKRKVDDEIKAVESGLAEKTELVRQFKSHEIGINKFRDEINRLSFIQRKLRQKNIVEQFTKFEQLDIEVGVVGSSIKRDQDRLLLLRARQEKINAHFDVVKTSIKDRIFERIKTRQTQQEKS